MGVAYINCKESPISRIHYPSNENSFKRINQDVSEQRNSLTIVEQPNLKFDPNKITVLNLNLVDGAKQHIFQTGCLPEWILNFANLQTLRASRLGILILEPWILKLKHINSIYLEHNQINTWPYFLRDSKSLELVNLEGNPCLEKAFHKSPTLRSIYFSWFYSTDACRTVPSYIRGPEWPPAASARQSNNPNLKSMGFFCGGIYASNNELYNRNDDLLTTLQPCPLQQRIYSNNENNNRLSMNPSPTDTKSTENSSIYSISPTKQDLKEPILLFEIFDDISILKNSENYSKPSTLRPRVLLIGSSKDCFNRLISFKAGSIQHQMLRHALLLLEAEELYIQKLQTVNSQFYNAKAKATSITNSLRDIFSGFPTMLSIHINLILPTLKILIKAIGSIHSERTNSSPNQRTSCSIRSAVEQLCMACSRLGKVLEQYTYKICDAEYLLDISRSPAILYEDEEFSECIKSRISRLGSSTYYLGSTISGSGTSTNGLEFSRKGSTWDQDPIETSSTKLRRNKVLSNWIFKQQHRFSSYTRNHPAIFFYLPLVQLVRFERFFTSFSKVSSQFDPLSHLLKKQRSCAATEIQAARQRARCHILGLKFKTNSSFYDNYLWDAVIAVRSRGYFEPGILGKNTNDVLINETEPVSFVKEVFTLTQSRILRLVCCNNEISIWDELFEQFITKISKNSLIAMKTSGEKHRSIRESLISTNTKITGNDHAAIGSSNSEIRLIFVDNKETCLVEVKGFSARYLTTADYRKEFLDACRVQCKDVF